MNYQTYINLTDEFVEGLETYLKRKGVPIEEVVEVFAGNGALGLKLGLREDWNISDLLTYTYEEHKDSVNENWDSEPYGVVQESAFQTVIRFSAEEGNNIRLLIMAAPPEVEATREEMKMEAYCCSAYEAAKALYHRFDAKLLYIGEPDSGRFASGKFFRHLEPVEDDTEKSFETLVVRNYDSKNGYFTSDHFEESIGVHPYLFSFQPCEEEECDCRDDSYIRSQVQSYIDEKK